MKRLHAVLAAILLCVMCCAAPSGNAQSVSGGASAGSGGASAGGSATVGTGGVTAGGSTTIGGVTVGGGVTIGPGGIGGTIGGGIGGIIGGSIGTGPLASASGQVANATNSGASKFCPGDGLSARIVSCVKAAALRAGERYFSAFSRYFKPAITATLTLAVAIYGALVLLGGVNLPKDTTILLLKIGSVIYFTANFDALFRPILETMEDLLNIVSSAVPVNQSLTCAGVSADQQVWKRVDCMLNMVIGITPGVLITTGMFGFIMSALFMLPGKIGIAIFSLGLGIVLTLLFAVARALFTFITSYVAIVILLSFAPLFIPMILFRQTKSMFDKWSKMIFGYALQPMVLVAYLSLMLVAFDTIMFSGKNSVYYSIAGPEALAPNFSLNYWLRSHGVYQDSFQFNWTLDTNPSEIDVPKLVEDTGVPGLVPEYIQKGIADTLKKQGTVMIGLPIEVISMERLAALKTLRERPKGPPFSPSEMANSILLSMTAAAIVSYVMFSLLSYIPKLGRDLAEGALGDGGISSGLASVQNKIVGGMKGALQGRGGA